MGLAYRLLVAAVIAMSSSISPASASAQHSEPVLAVAPFDDLSSNDALTPLGTGLAAMLTTDLSLSPAVRVVERSRLSEVIGELRLQQTPWVDQASAAELGRLLGADFLVV